MEQRIVSGADEKAQAVLYDAMYDAPHSALYECIEVQWVDDDIPKDSS